MYNCITTFPQKYDAYVNKTFYVHLKFNKFHYSHTIVAMVSFYDQNMHLIYGFDQFQTLKSFKTLHLNLPFQMRSWNLSIMMLSFIQLSVKNCT